jgi:selenium metabolism protein YedF
MTTTVDACGLACPQPVILARKAMEGGGAVVVVVDNEAARANVSRMASKAGWEVNVVPQGDKVRIELSPPAGAEGTGVAQAAPAPAARAGDAASGPLVLVVGADVMGRGQAELGNILVRGFFHTLGEVAPLPQTIIFFNTGVKLACEGSPVLEDLCALEAEGVEMLVCGTCLGYFELADRLAAGQVSNMYDIAETMLGAGRAVNL